MSTVFYFDEKFGSENMQVKQKVFKLQGLNESSPFYDKSFSDLSQDAQRKLRDSVLRAINIRQIKPEYDYSCMYHIFERLNTGGTPLKSQEIRNVVYRGKIVNVLRDLNQNTYWRSIVGIKGIDRHQRDVELILRIFALSNFLDSYEKPMKDFLNSIMDKNRGANGVQFKKFVGAFPKMCESIVEKFGDKPFHLRGPLNTSVLDAVFCTLLINAKKIPQNISTRYEKIKTSKKFEKLTTRGTTDAQTVRDRFKLTHDLLIK